MGSRRERNRDKEKKKGKTHIPPCLFSLSILLLILLYLTFCLPPPLLFLPYSSLCSVSHLFRFGVVIKHPSHRHFDSQGEIEAWGLWKSCVLFCIISIYRRTNVPVLQGHDWPVKQQHAPGKPCSSSSLYCLWRTPKGANTFPVDSSSFTLKLKCVILRPDEHYVTKKHPKWLQGK